MEEYRCKSYSDGRMEIERCSSTTTSYSGNGNTHTSETSSSSNNNNNGVVFEHIRSYSTSSYATSVQQPKELRKDKRANGSFSKSSAWCFGDPELQRKKRVASYKSYNVEGKLKRSFSKSFRWIKHRYSNMIHGS